MIKRLGSVACLVLLSACNGPSDSEVEGLKANTDALFDMDVAASEALRSDLQARFGANPALDEVKAKLQEDGYDCQPDPAAPREEACLKEEPVDGCTAMTIVRVKPWRPQLAQVIMVCETGSAPEAPAPSATP
jgi:hypothetical protein